MLNANIYVVIKYFVLATARLRICCRFYLACQEIRTLAILSMSDSSPANQALIAYVIGIILLLAFSMLIGTMIKGEAEKQALILLNPVTITSQVLNTGDSELCKKKTWRGRFCPPISMPLSHPDL